MLSSRLRGRLGVRIAAALLLVALAPVGIVGVLARDEASPAALGADPRDAERLIVGQFDLIPLVDHVRYADMEYRQSDDLVLLYFEVRRYPYLWSREIWLGSRCVPPADFTADTFAGMDGGPVQSSRVSDPELIYVRGPDQSPC